MRNDFNRSRIFSLLAPLLFACFFLSLSSPALAKVFYATVTRDFATGENPLIQLTYGDRERPFTIRILKPNDLKDFVAHQLDIRRTWKQPEVKFNSGKYLIDGFNTTTWDWSWLRTSLSSEVRQPLLPTLGGNIPRIYATPIEAGPKKLIRIPAGFQVFQEFTFLPKTDVGKATPFDVPGFDFFSDFNGNGQKEAKVQLPVLPNGVYLVQFLQGTYEGQVLIVVNDLRASLSQSDAKVLIHVSDRKGAPVEKAQISLRGLNGTWIANAVTDKNGAAETTVPNENDLVTIVESPQGVAIVDSEFFPNTVTTPDVMLFTDRPLYHPTDTLYFKGISRQLKDGLSQVFSTSHNIPYYLNDHDNNKVGDAVDVTMNDYGTYDGKINFQDIASGLYSVTSAIEGVTYGGDVRVKEFKKPLIKVEFPNPPASVEPGHDLVVPVKLTRYSGEPIGKVKLRADLQRVRFEGPEWIESAGAGETGSKTNYGFDSSKKEAILPIPILAQEDINVDSSGNATIHLSVPAELPGPANYDYKLSLLVSAQDEDGGSANGAASFFESADPLLVQTHASAVMTQKDTPSWVEIRTVSPSGTGIAGVAGQATITINSETDTDKILLTKEFVTDKEGRFKLDVPSSQVGELEIRTALKVGGVFVPKKSDLLFVADENQAKPIRKVAELSLFVRRTTFAPDETAQVLAVLPAKWGIKGSEKGIVHTTLAADRIFETGAQEVSGRALWIPVKLKSLYGTSVYLIVSYSDPELGWVERKVSFRILDPSRLLGIQIHPKLEVASPGETQSLEFTVLNSQNQGTKAELAVSVVDEALLAVQGEFRPSMIDFFYPLQRLNLATFLSSDIQGYGYAEMITRNFAPNYSWAATKGQALKLEDTAYWNPRVETDDQGHAKVDFRLPANRTNWKVMAVAVDKTGRFGESKGVFAARSDTNINLAMPTMFRIGDSADAILSLRNQSATETKTFNVKVMLPPEISSTEELNSSGDLAPTLTFLKKVTIKGLQETGPKGAEFSTQLTVNGKVQEFLTDMRVRTNTYSSVAETVTAEQTVTAQIPSHSQIRSVDVFVVDGFSGTVMGALDWLVHYPYGCAEQVTSATIPNVVLAQLLVPELKIENKYKIRDTFSLKLFYRLEMFWARLRRWVGAHNPLSSSVQLTEQQVKQLEDAQVFANAGLKRLQTLQLGKGYHEGGFQWFEGTDASPLMTHLVLMSLLQLDNFNGIELKPEAAYRYLKDNTYGIDSAEIPEVIQNSLLLYEQLKLQSQKKIEEQPALASLKVVFEAALKSDQTLLLSLGLLSAQLADANQQSEIAGLRSKMAEQLVEKVSNPKKGRFSNSSIENFLNEDVAIAMAGRALAQENKMTTELKEKLAVTLSQNFMSGHFWSTFQTAQTMLWSSWLIQYEYLERSLVRKPEFKSLPQALDLQKAAIEPSLAGWHLSWSNVQNSEATLAFRLPDNSPQKLDVAVALSTPLDDVAAVHKGKLTLERAFFIVNNDKSLTPVTENNVKAGDLIYVAFHVHGGWPYHYYVIETEVPGGTEWVDEDDRYSDLPGVRNKGLVAKRETKSDVLRLYLDGKTFKSDLRGRRFHRKGKKTVVESTDPDQLEFGAVFRVQYPGSFTAGVGRIVDFYDTKNFSQTGSQRLGVVSAQR